MRFPSLKRAAPKCERCGAILPEAAADRGERTCPECMRLARWSNDQRRGFPTVDLFDP